MTWRKVANRASNRRTWEDVSVFINGEKVGVKDSLLLPEGVVWKTIWIPRPRYIHLTRAKRRRRDRYDMERMARIRASGVAGPIGYARHAARKGEACEIVMYSGLSADAAREAGLL